MTCAQVTQSRRAVQMAAHGLSRGARVSPFCLYIDVCFYVHTHAHTCSNMIYTDRCVYMYISFVHVYVRVNTHKHTHSFTHPTKHTHTHMHHTHIPTAYSSLPHKHAHIHTNMHTYTHTNTHTYRLLPWIVWALIWEVPISIFTFIYIFCNKLMCYICMYIS